MNVTLRETLDRTLLLMRDELIAELSDARLLEALTDTEIVLAGDSRNLSSHAAQCAYVTAAMLMARSGHRVFLAAPDVPLVGPQPPLIGDRLVGALLEVGGDLLPGPGFSVYAPRREAGLMVVFGDSAPRYGAQRVIGVNATAWGAQLARASETSQWIERDWPCGALGAAVLASAEAFKVAMLKLRQHAKDARHFADLFAFADHATVELAPAHTPQPSALDVFDLFSGGAVINAFVYVLARLLGVTGRGYVVEPEVADPSNLNRYVLLRRSAIARPKAEILKAVVPQQLELDSIPLLYRGGLMPELGQFAPRVLVGTDDIPVRWQVQAERPPWLGIGATTHWAAMASFHREGLGCARCLHPRDEPTAGPIPTIAFVSFFAGLMLSCYFIRTIAGERVSPNEQYRYASPLRPEHIWRSPVAVRAECPTCQSRERMRAA